MSAESVYSSYLDELKETAVFVRSCVAFRPIAAAHIQRGSDAQVDGMVREFLAAPHFETRVYQSFLVAAHAGFEQFFVSLQEDVCAYVNEKCIAPAELELKLPGIVARFRRVSGTALTGIFEPKEHWKIDYEALVEALSSTHRGAAKAALMGRVFVVEGGSIDSEAIRKRLGSYGCKFEWDDVGRQPGIAGVLGVSGVRAVGKAAKELIDELCSKRNALAHSQGSLPVEQEDLLKYLSFYRLLTEYISKLLLQHIKAKLA